MDLTKRPRPLSGRLWLLFAEMDIITRARSKARERGDHYLWILCPMAEARQRLGWSVLSKRCEKREDFLYSVWGPLFDRNLGYARKPNPWSRGPRWVFHREGKRLESLAALFPSSGSAYPLPMGGQSLGGVRFDANHFWEKSR